MTRPAPVVQDRYYGIVLPLLAVLQGINIWLIVFSRGLFDASLGHRGLAFVLTLKAIEYRRLWLNERRQWRWRG